ncbi:hypothetical protein V6N13_025505 [Hibiscus sabdariffa]
MGSQEGGCDSVRQLRQQKDSSFHTETGLRGVWSSVRMLYRGSYLRVCQTTIRSPFVVVIQTGAPNHSGGLIIGAKMTKSMASF